MRRIVLFAAIAALLAPAAALAAKPPHPSTPATPTVTYILRGTLTAYTAAPGSVTIMVTNGNHVAGTLKNHSYTLSVTTETKISGTVTVGHKGIVKFRGKKGLTDAGGQTATQVIDQGSGA